MNREAEKRTVIELLLAGMTMRGAARKVGVRASSIYRWRDADPKFAEALKDAEQKRKPRMVSDEALERAIMKRGRQLTAMMRTPVCMWPTEWLDTEDDNE